MKTTKIGRLAMRHEGNFWNAYYAMPDTMDGAILLGCIAMKAVVGKPARKNAFMEMMQEFVAELIRANTGEDVAWPSPPTAAPEHERSGNA